MIKDSFLAIIRRRSVHAGRGMQSANGQPLRCPKIDRVGHNLREVLFTAVMLERHYRHNLR